MLIFTFLTACAPESVSLQWFEDDVGECSVDGSISWAAPEDPVLALSVRREGRDGRSLYVSGGGVVVDANRNLDIDCVSGDAVYVTYALRVDD